MVPALWAVVLAGRGTPPWLLVGIIILGSLVTSAAGCVVNDLWDRDIDPQVARTRQRPLASRQLSGQVGLVVAFLAFACAYGLTYFLNPLTFWLSVAAVPVIVFYPLAKRFFPIPQLVLALAWGFAVLISWTAVTAKLEPATWLLWGATVLWTLGFDTIYAMADREDDRRIGIHSSARFFGIAVEGASNSPWSTYSNRNFIQVMNWESVERIAAAGWGHWALTSASSGASRKAGCWRHQKSMALPRSS